MIDEKKLIERLWEQHKGVKANAECYANAEEVADEICNVVSIIDDQPKVGEWIPCSERLPSETEAWYFNEQEGIHEPNEFIVQVKGAKLPTVAIFNGESFTHIYTDDGYGFIDEIIAWQPLPEPYKEGET